MRILPAALALAALASPAAAHAPEGAAASLAAGLAHPLLGLDHVLAMVAVGLWAGATGGRAAWALPAAFVAAMVAGFALALAGVGLPAVEPAILASAVVLGAAVALAARPGLGAAAVAVAAVGLVHGQAHGAELGAADAWRFGAGFAVATAALHAAGLGLAMRSGALARALGMATALAGAALALA